MAKKIGVLRVEHEGKDYRLCLTNTAIGALQDAYGLDLKVFQTGQVPHFGALVLTIKLALQRYHPDEATTELADDILGADRLIFGKLQKVTFPDVKEDSNEAGGNRKKRRAAKKKANRPKKKTS